MFAFNKKEPFVLMEPNCIVLIIMVIVNVSFYNSSSNLDTPKTSLVTQSTCCYRFLKFECQKPEKIYQ